MADWQSEDGSVQLFRGDCLEVLLTLAENSVDAVVTDPPYGLGFMGKDWDHGVPGEHFWREILRIAKPGAHLLAFGGTRTVHRLVCAIEDAGWEIRDRVLWLHGQGIPKSRDISKAIDKEAGMERQAIGVSERQAAGFIRRGRTDKEVFSGVNVQRIPATITLSATDAARQWEGWGTALKPAFEPICLARKPLSESTVAANVLKWGTGGLNIDGCRVKMNEKPRIGNTDKSKAVGYGCASWQKSGTTPVMGRWPANVLHDGSPEVVEMFPSEGNGSAARFFYCAKASKKDRDEGLESTNRNAHPTVKPTPLMRYLSRLITPPKGIVLDPFMGSGSTGKAAVQEDFRFIGIETEAEYVEIARRRIEHALRDRANSLPLEFAET